MVGGEELIPTDALLTWHLLSFHVCSVNAMIFPRKSRHEPFAISQIVEPIARVSICCLAPFIYQCGGKKATIQLLRHHVLLAFIGVPASVSWFWFIISRNSGFDDFLLDNDKEET